MKKFVFSTFLLFFILAAWAGQHRALLINLGPYTFRNFIDFNNEINLINKKYPKDAVSILNGAGKGTQFQTWERDPANSYIYTEGTESDPANLRNIHDRIEAEMKDSSKPSFLFFTGHGGFGYAQTWHEDGSLSEYLEFEHLVKQIKNRPDKNKSVKLLLTSCYSGSILNEFNATKDFDGNFCLVASARGSQVSISPNHKTLDTATTLDQYSRAYDETKFSSVIKSSERFAELALSEMVQEKTKSSRCENIPLDLESLDFYKLQQKFKDIEIYAETKLISLYGGVSEECEFNDFLDQVPSVKFRYNKIREKYKNEHFSYEGTNEILQLYKENDAFPWEKRNQQKIFKCIMTNLPEGQDEVLRRIVSTFSPPEDFILPVDKEDEKKVPSTNFQETIESLIAKKDPLGQKYRDIFYKELLKRPDILSHVADQLKFIAGYDSGEIAKKADSSLKEFEQLLNTPAGAKYRKTYEALRKCESEPLN